MFQKGGEILCYLGCHIFRRCTLLLIKGEKKYWNHIDGQQPTLVQDVPPPSYISCHSLTSLSAISTHNENEHANVENSSNVFAFESLLQEENQS